jgi:hypothetical protein
LSELLVGSLWRGRVVVVVEGKVPEATDRPAPADDDGWG